MLLWIPGLLASIQPGVSWSAQDVVHEWIPGLEQAPLLNASLLDPNTRKPVELSLLDCIHRALVNNLDIRVDSYGPAIRMADVAEAEAAFDSVMFATSQADLKDRTRMEANKYTRTITTPSGTTTVTIPEDMYTHTHDYNYLVGLKKRLPTGAMIQLAEGLRRFHDFRDYQDNMVFNPYHEYELNLQIQQPLLRNFGVDLNRAGINAARNNYQIGLQQWQLRVMSIVAEVESNYWRLMFQRQQVRIYAALLNRAMVTRKRLEFRRELEASALIIHRNIGLIARSQANLVSAQNDLIQQQERLLLNLNDPNLPISYPWEIVPLDTPVVEAYHMDAAEAIDLALHVRPEVISQKLTLDTASIRVGVAKNQELPALDITASQKMTGAEGSSHEAWNNQQGYDLIDYGVGLSFEVPLGNRAARAARLRSERQYQQESARLENVRQQVVADVNITVNALGLSYQEMLSRRQETQAEADTLKAYTTQEEAGVAISAGFLDRQLDAQERLALAQIRSAQSQFEYNRSILEAQRAQGTLLRYNNIKLAEEPY